MRLMRNCVVSANAPLFLNFLFVRYSKHSICRQKFLCANELSANGMSANDIVGN